MEKAAAVGAAGAATGLAGCSGQGNDGGGDGDGGDGGGGGGGGGGTSGNGEQDFLWWTMRGYIPAETQAIKDAAAGYEDAADANVNLSTEVITWDQVFQEWSASLEGRAMPNVSEMACEHAVDFGHRGAARPNTELFNQYDDWYDTISYWGDFDGEFWGLPWFMELRTSHVNMDILDEAGVSGPPETWEEIVEVGQQVSENTDASGWATPGAQDFVTGQNMVAFAHQSDGGFYGFENEEFSVEIDGAASLFAHLWTVSLREKWDIAPGGWGGLDSTATEELYRAGRAGITHLPTDLARSLIDPQDGVNSENSEIAEATELTPMPAGPNGESHSFMGGSCLTVFRGEVTNNDVEDQISLGFVDYMTQPDTQNQYFPVSAPNFLPVRAGQEESELFTDNPTEIPDSWMEARLEQAPNAIRYGVTGAQRSAPFLGALEGSTTAYSAALSGMIGSDTDPKKALRDLGNQMRSTMNDADYLDYQLDEKTEGPSLDDAPDSVQPWITGDGAPEIFNPYA
jgi:multiple sugar transport system substrate-binding protein